MKLVVAAKALTTLLMLQQHLLLLLMFAQNYHHHTNRKKTKSVVEPKITSIANRFKDWQILSRYSKFNSALSSDQACTKFSHYLTSQWTLAQGGGRGKKNAQCGGCERKSIRNFVGRSLIFGKYKTLLSKFGQTSGCKVLYTALVGL